MLLPSKEYLPVATTRPETISGDTAVCVHPDDERFKHLVGKQVLVPMGNGRTIPVIADDYVDMEFGTGALKITPGHDPNDYTIGKKYNLPIINIMNKDGSMNANAGQSYEGLDRFECRTQLWSDMEEAGLVIKVDPHMQRVPRSQRGGDVIEPLVSSQWFVKTEGMGRKALEAVQKGDIPRDLIKSGSIGWKIFVTGVFHDNCGGVIVSQCGILEHRAKTNTLWHAMKRKLEKKPLNRDMPRMSRCDKKMMSLILGLVRDCGPLPLLVGLKMRAWRDPTWRVFTPRRASKRVMTFYSFGWREWSCSALN
jgi:hypothetical protein